MQKKIEVVKSGTDDSTTFSLLDDPQTLRISKGFLEHL